MKVIARTRGTGKTKELFLLANKNNGQILTLNKRALRSKAESYGMPSLTIVDWDDLMYGRCNPKQPLYIDNAESVMAELFKNDFELKLEGMNVNLED